MKIISEIADDMMSEVHDAKHRIKRAFDMKALYPNIAQREYEIATQEMSHADKDHSSVVELISAYKQEKGEPPAVMMAIWKEKHDKYMEKYAKVKNMIDLYNKS